MNSLKKFIYVFQKYSIFEILKKKTKIKYNGSLISYKPIVTNNLEFEFFLIHKAASNFSNKILKQIEKNTEYSLYDYGALVGSLADRLNIKDDFENYLNKNNEFHFFFKPYLR